MADIKNGEKNGEKDDSNSNPNVAASNVGNVAEFVNTTQQMDLTKLITLMRMMNVP